MADTTEDLRKLARVQDERRREEQRAAIERSQARRAAQADQNEESVDGDATV